MSILWEYLSILVISRINLKIFLKSWSTERKPITIGKSKSKGMYYLYDVPDKGYIIS
jgi:hypothetical protein